MIDLAHELAAQRSMAEAAIASLERKVQEVRRDAERKIDLARTERDQLTAQLAEAQQRAARYQARCADLMTLPEGRAFADARARRFDLEQLRSALRDFVARLRDRNGITGPWREVRVDERLDLAHKLEQLLPERRS